MNKTVLDFPEVLDTEDADVLYTIRGLSDTRDKKTTKATFLSEDRLKGIASYDSTFEYLADGSIVQYGNLIWRSIAGTELSPNIGNTPSIANLDKWELVSVFTVPISITETTEVVQNIQDLFLTSIGNSAINTITIPAGVRIGQQITVLATGIYNTIVAGIEESITLIDRQVLKLVWDGTYWTSNLKFATVSADTVISGNIKTDELNNDGSYISIKERTVVDDLVLQAQTANGSLSGIWGNIFRSVYAGGLDIADYDDVFDAMLIYTGSTPDNNEVFHWIGRLSAASTIKFNYVKYSSTGTGQFLLYLGGTLVGTVANGDTATPAMDIFFLDLFASSM